MQIVDTRPPQAKQENRIFRAIGCTAVYLTSARARSAAWQGLAGRCSARGGWHGAAVGTLFSAEASKDSKISSGFSLSAAWRCGVVLWEPSRDGVCLFLNRLFAASELQQAYLYEKLPVRAPQAEQAGCLQAAAILLGLLFAQLLTLPGRFSRTFVLAALCGAMAYLGVLPERGWLIALAGCLLLTLFAAGRQTASMAASSDHCRVCPSDCGLPASAGNGERAAFGMGGTCARSACHPDGSLRRTSGTAGCLRSKRRRANRRRSGRSPCKAHWTETGNRFPVPFARCW